MGEKTPGSAGFKPACQLSCRTVYMGHGVVGCTKVGDKMSHCGCARFRTAYSMDQPEYIAGQFVYPRGVGYQQFQEPQRSFMSNVLGRNPFNRKWWP